MTVLNELLRRVENGVDVFGLHLKTATGMSGAVLGIALILMLRWRPAGLLSAFELQIEGRERPSRQGPVRRQRAATASPGETHAGQRV